MEEKLEIKASVAPNESSFSGWEKERPSCPLCSQGWDPRGLDPGQSPLALQEMLNLKHVPGQAATST